MNSSLDGVLVIDSRGKTLLRNRGFVDMWKLPQKIVDEKDEKGQWSHTLSRVVHPEAFKEKVRFLHGNPRETARYEVELTDGTILDTYSCPVLGKDRDILRPYLDLPGHHRAQALLDHAGKPLYHGRAHGTPKPATVR